MNEVKNIHLVQLDEMMTNRTGTNAMYTKWATNYEKVCRNIFLLLLVKY